MALRRIAMTIIGRVQGVGFRYFTQEVADSLGVTGWVRNGWNRDVEVEAQADSSTLAVFQDRLREGPVLSRVTNIDAHDIQVVVGDAEFTIRH